VLMSAAGKLFRQEAARRYAKLSRVIFICGRYEGVDERVAEHLATEEVSVGDFVLSGGELPAVMILDAVTRLLPGALGNEDSTVNESFSESGAALIDGGTDEASAGLGDARIEGGASPAPTRRSILLDFPHYTRPAEFRGWSVPEVLIGGNHAEVAKWRRAAAMEKTRRNRPELIERQKQGSNEAMK
jgi:tRNA (guanine37-N1)-methyltransferase